MTTPRVGAAREGAGVGGGGPSSLRSWVRRARERPALRRLAICCAAGLLLAVMTGPPGSSTAPTSGLAASLGRPTVVLWLAGGLALWCVVTAYLGHAEELRSVGRTLIARSDRVFSPPRVRYPAYVVVLGLASVVPLYLSGFWQEVLVDQVGVFVLLALGLNVVVGFAGLLDLGFIAFFAIGAYTTAFWTDALPLHPPVVLNPFLVIPLAVVTAMIAGVILGAPTLRLRGDYLAIVTLGFGEIIQIVANNLTSITGGAQGVGGRRPAVPHFSINTLGVHYRWTLSNLPYYYLLLAFVLIAVVAFRLLERSRVGRAWTAIREDEVAAEACGINSLKYKIMAFAIGASTSGLAGVLFASKIGFFDPPTFGVQISILVLVLVVFGGMGSIYGAVIGAAVLEFLPQLIRHLIKQQDLYIYYGALLVVMMIFRPQGLLPSRQRAREFGLAESGIGSADALGAPGEAP